MIALLSHIAYASLRMLSFLPLSALYFLSDFICFVTYHVVRYRRAVVYNNLKNSFPDKTDKEIKAIEKEFYRHFCDMFIVTLKLWTIDENEIKRRCRFLNPDVIDRYREQGRSIVTVLGHYSNWEWMTSFAIWRPHQVLLIYKPLHNKVFDKMYIRIRERFGAKTLPRDDTLRTMISYKQNNEFTATVFLGDQTPNRRSINYWTRFLNQDTPILQGTERIAKKLDQAVVYIVMRKLKRGYYEVEFIPLEDHPKNAAEFEITEKHTRMLENIIKKEPAYWLWSHRRWKHKKEQQPQ